MTDLSISGIQFEISFIFALYTTGAIVFLCTFILLYILRIRSEMKRLSGVQKWLVKVRSQQNFDHKMTVLLEAVSHQFNALSYALYIYDERYDKFMLRASRFQTTGGSGDMASTNALVSSPEDNYKPAMTASKLFLISKIEILKEGEVPLLVIPISGKGIIRIGPVHQVTRGSKRRLKHWLDFVKPMVDELIEAEQMKEQSNIALSSKNAIVNLSKIALEKDQALEQIIPFCLSTLKVSGGCLVRIDNDKYSVKTNAGVSSEIIRPLSEDLETLHMYRAFSKKDEIHFVKTPLPSYFLEKGIQHVLLVSIESHYYVFWSKSKQERRAMTLFLQTLIYNYRQFAKVQADYLRGSGAYVPLLQALARLLDDLSPNSIGYSELMSRYSIVIARQMGLKDSEIRDVAIAAYLSHIGTIALSIDLFRREGQYTGAEFELMKMHAEVSALIVSFATGNERSASYIRHHHERVDGHGYPAGLKGDEIPVGARIIAVVQTFLAKVNGRSYRKPLSFDQSLQTLRSESGQQLDSEMVEVFLGWYSDKRFSQIDSNKALGSCSDMCCVPVSICRSCPAYGRTDANCWETEGVLCDSHGKSCDSCFVKTEVQARKKLVVTGSI